VAVTPTNLPAVALNDPGLLANTNAVHVAVNALTANPLAQQSWTFGPLPHVVVNTAASVPVTSTEVYVNATMTINGQDAYSGPLTIKGRGNTTWGAPKKPYRLKLATAAALLGMPEEKDWVLLANYYDPISLRTAVAMDIGSRIPGNGWVPRMRFVEFTLNGVFQGIYQLGEQAEFGVTKTNASATKATATTGLGLTGAYSLEVDQRLESGTDIGFRTTLKNLPVVMDSPDGTVPEQKAYIQQWMNDFETVLFGPNWLDPVVGYARLIDAPSFIGWYLVNELMKNVDSNFYSSCKLYKTADTATVPGKLFFGPLWDFDRSLGFSGMTPQDWWVRVSTEASHPGAIWIDRMMGDPTFWAALVAQWNLLVTAMTTGDTVNALIDRLTDRLSFATARDKRLWTYTADNPVLGDAAKSWLAQRIAWLSGKFTPETTPPSVPGSVSAIAGDTVVALSWTASTDNVFVSKYRVRRGGAVLAEPYSPGFVDSGLANGTAVSYTVSAVDPWGNESAQSVAVTVTPAVPGPDTIAPTTPTNLTATPGNVAVALSWTASTDNVAVTGYRVRRGGTLVGSPTGTTYSDTGLVNGTTYSYTVSAIDAVGNESAQTAAVTAVPTAAVVPIATETWTGADGAVWPAGWTTYRNATIQGGRGRLASLTTANVSPSWFGSMSPVADFNMYVTITLGTATGSFWVGVASAAADNSEPYADGSVVKFGIGGGNISELVVRGIKAGNAHEVAYASISSAPVVPSATGVRVRVQRVGALVQAKVWPAGTTEPATWRISGTDATPPTSTANRAFLSYAANSNTYVDFDDLTFVATA
jgi:chitodextrinase